MKIQSGAAMRALLLGVALSAVSAAAFAQDGEATVVDTVIVTALRNPEEPPVVGAARERLSETPGAVAVVSQESYETRFAATLADTLRNVPGVYVQPKFGEDVRISIRGSGLGNNFHNRGLLLSQDGIPFNEADGFGDFQLIDPLATRFTEVYKGGNALRFGGALLGGAINHVTITGENAPFENRVRLEAGSFGTYRLHGAAARDYDVWDAAGALTFTERGGYREHEAGSATRFSVNAGHDFGPDRQVRVYLSGGDVSQEIAGSVSLASALNDPRAANAGNLAQHYQRNMESLRGAVQTDWRLAESLTVSGGLYAVWKDLDHPIFQVIDQQSRNYGAFARFDWTGQRADGFFGVWYRTGNIDNQRWMNLAGARGAQTARSFDESTALDIFAEGRLFLTESFALVAGGSWGRATRDYTGLFGSNLVAAANYDWFAPRIGFVWQAEDGAQIYGNVTKSVEPPHMSGFVQAGAPVTSLVPQEAWTAELGARGRRGPFTWDVVAYRAELDGELLSFTVSPGIPASTFNAGETVHQGIEAALDWRFAEGWRLRQTYAWSDFTFDNDPVYGNNDLPIVPEHFYRAELRYDAPGGWFLAPSVDWQLSDIWADFNNTVRSPDFIVLNFNAGVSPRDGVTLFVEGRNILDERYVSNVSAAITATPASPNFYPGEGRGIFVGLTGEF